MTQVPFHSLAVAAAAAVIAGCAGTLAVGPVAEARLDPTRGNATAGSATFQVQGDTMTLHVKVEGLKPGAEHGFHIHEKGDCSSGDGMSTGGHFNPGGKAHGQHGVGEHHAGDLPSLKADASGKVDLRVRLAAGLAIGSGPADIVGRGLIVHAQPDDYKTQPTGNSGARIACGVIARKP